MTRRFDFALRLGGRSGAGAAGLLAAVLLLSGTARAQVQDYPRPRADLDKLVQELFAEPQSDQENYEDLYENLLQYLQTPLNLNTANREELSSLLLLSEPQITALLEHRQLNGPLLALYELQSIRGFDVRTIYRVAPFVTVGTTDPNAARGPLWKRIWQEDNNALFLRYERVLQDRRGYAPVVPNSSGELPSHYLGSPDKMLVRFRTSHARDFSVGFAAEKDAGEQFTWDSKTRRYGFDYYSAHFALFDRGRLKSVVIGDYQLQFGQGLLLSSGLQVGKGAETITTLRRSNVGVRPYSSVLETAFFRGAAATVALTPALKLTGFASRKRIDATLRTSTVADSLRQADDFNDFASGLPITGFHRTASELANRQSLPETVTGGDLSFAPGTGRLNLGLTAVNTLFDKPIQKRPEPYNFYEFSGRHNLAVSTHYSYGWRNVSLFGETARSQSGGIGTINGLLASLGPTVDASVLFRRYDQDFHTLYGNALSENTRNINENGLYLGLKLRPIARWELSAYYDQFRFPWLRYQVGGPSSGYDWLLRVSFAPTKTSQLYAQIRTRLKEYDDATSTRPMPEPVPVMRRSLLLFYDTSPTPTLSLRTRVQGVRYRENNGPVQSGYVLAQDVTVQPWQRLRLTARYALFDTDGYDTRQYVYEQDVLYAFSIPVLYGRGTRYYALAEVKLNRRLTLWLRFANTRYRHQQTVGSGLDQIQGAERSDVKAQLRVAL
ncbi:helix-hairpin-helix domain-containing protein [Hymenobacter sp. 15J16-1T3B]|uniref:helix-hairpin-helix domain-containing protein n=1 Tax=Hymenobacter sp. 15J16-1T3B TaxID=2886941 RepID=UPI001D10B1E3|nr:helix-hairpin-helix domain-containing protein [Hymenobacter sp. 15J16-1T3B]MCC3158837.1 helix-hairpin-helix domain-containing protein [Hymenobacter sp. 15J16-1T3B]